MIQYSDAISILMEGTNGTEYDDVRTILEDASSPVGKRYQEKLFKSVIEKGHINFSSIPTSAGDIKKYEGYQNMVDTLTTMGELAQTQKSPTVSLYVNAVKTAIHNIEMLAPSYTKGFTNHSEYVMLEYNTYVYACVQATTTLLYEFVEYVKRPDQKTLSISLKNNKSRANAFYFDQLGKFNNVISNMGMDYRKMLDSISNKGKENFIGTSEVIGMAAVALVAYSIIPITRELVYKFYKFRGDLSSSLSMQAQFLEMNKACVEANQTFTEDEKKKILLKQDKIRKSLTNLAEKIRVKDSKSTLDSKKELERDNKLLSIDNIKNDISNSDIELF